MLLLLGWMTAHAAPPPVLPHLAVEEEPLPDAPPPTSAASGAPKARMGAARIALIVSGSVLAVAGGTAAIGTSVWYKGDPEVDMPTWKAAQVLNAAGWGLLGVGTVLAIVPVYTGEGMGLAVGGTF